MRPTLLRITPQKDHIIGHGFTHGHGFFSRLSLHRQNCVLGLSFTWFASILLHDLCLISLPLRNMGFWPHYVICVVLGMINWINAWIAPCAQDAEDSYVFSTRDRSLFASSWFASCSHESQSLGCLQRVLGHSMDDAWVQFLLFESISYPTLPFMVIKTRWRTVSFSR